MKKILMAVFTLSSIAICRADNFCTDWGQFNLCLPITTGIDTAYGYDLKGKQSQGLADTSFGKWNVPVLNSSIDFRFGGVISEYEKASPYLGLNYGMINPLSQIVDVSPGIYGGKNFNDGSYFWGIKASIQFIQPKTSK